ncbi:hypothetical protein GCM10027034_05710 [Ramlibacter solisilvae]|uniref:Uncharacterized protein n=1 Tax=Ramlibacter tataouinensis TaxID=94132 RepID=A0A127JYP8_9BURK|nr:hypothetical protein [Ramlibacter tataouinensis]AMO25005.1 hypothetical protein UC35_21960 [Ramlibacter tataouinensis]
MRTIFGVLGLLVVVAVVGVLVKKQLGAATGSAAALSAPAGTAPMQQVQQVQRAVEAAVQQARPDGSR